MKRVPTAELLDTDSGTPAEITASLQDLRTINTKFGGAATTEALIRHIVDQTGQQSFSVLEVAAGAGDTPRMVKQHLQAQGIELEFTLLTGLLLTWETVLRDSRGWRAMLFRCRLLTTLSIWSPAICSLII